jgi:lysophospholipase L1-like esterase
MISSLRRRLVTLGAMVALVVASSPAATAGPARDTAAPLRVMPLGDSITYGIGSRTLDGYRAILRAELAAVGVDVDYVGSLRSGTGPDPDNEGHKGWTIEQLSEHVDDWLTTYRPDVILLHIGTNDMVRRVPDAPLHLDRLLDRIAAARPEAEVYVAQIVGIADRQEVGTRMRRTADYNAWVAQIVAARGERFHLVDQSDVRGPEDMKNRDHPNDQGYAEMAANWLAAMTA